MGEHKKFIQLAIDLALKTKVGTLPNPVVGAVIVKNNRVISTGFHKRAGTDHAEIVALGKNIKMGYLQKDATLYTNLEPCSTYGRTPPCTDAIIKSGIKKVVVAMLDPNPKHRGRGIKILKKNRIKVIVGILEQEARLINQPYIKFITKKLPYITYKTAQSIDGKIAARTGDSKWITSQIARDYARKTRDNFDAIMVGIGTLLKDNPRLNLNKKISTIGGSASGGKNFYRIIVDTNFRTPTDARLFKDAKKFPVIIATRQHIGVIPAKTGIHINTHNSPNFRLRGNDACDVTVLTIKKNRDNLLNLKDLLKKLAKLEIASILVEGGGRLAGSLFDQKLVDYVMFFISPKIIGGKDAISSVQGRGIAKLTRAQKLKNMKIRSFGEDFLVEGFINQY